MARNFNDQEEDNNFDDPPQDVVVSESNTLVTITTDDTTGPATGPLSTALPSSLSQGIENEGDQGDQGALIGNDVVVANGTAVATTANETTNSTVATHNNGGNITNKDDSDKLISSLKEEGRQKDTELQLKKQDIDHRRREAISNESKRKRLCQDVSERDATIKELKEEKKTIETEHNNEILSMATKSESQKEASDKEIADLKIQVKLREGEISSSNQKYRQKDSQLQQKEKDNVRLHQYVVDRENQIDSLNQDVREQEEKFEDLRIILGKRVRMTQGNIENRL